MSASEIISAWAGLPEDQIRIMVASILCIPLSFVMTDVPGAQLKRLYSTVLGFMLQWYVYGAYPFQLAMMFLLSTAVYLTVRVRRHSCGRLVTVGSILILSTLQIYRLITDYGSWTVDVTTVLMMVICKYSAFAYACEDGLKNQSALSEEQQGFRIDELPSFYEFISYLQFLPTATMGPYLEYREFDNYLKQEKQYATIPDQLPQMGRDFLEAIFHLVVYMVLYLRLFPIGYMATDAYQNLSWPLCIFYAWMSVTFIRFKYYFAWKLSSVSVDACGISYSGSTVDKEGKVVANWDIIQTCNAWQVETTLHIREKIKNWNISVQLWLTRCIYLRYRTPEQYKTDKKAQARGSLLVFMVSSFWHGFYFGYYLSFFFWYCFMQVAATVFRIHRNRPDLAKKYEDTGMAGHIVMWLAVNITFSYFGSYFQLMGAASCFAVMSRLWFLPEIIIVVLMLFLQNSSLARESKSSKANTTKPVHSSEQPATTTIPADRLTDQPATKSD